MGQIEQRTRLARLLIAPSPVVYEELKSYSAEIQASFYTAASEIEELEASLAARNDPLIDLAIASFGASKEIIGQLYQRAKAPATDEADAHYKQGLRLAALANETVQTVETLNWDRFPGSVIGESELALVLTSSDWIEAETLILNPTIADDVLLALYRGDKFCEGMDEDRRRQLVSMSGRNERLHTRNDNEHGPGMGHYYLHEAIFDMLASVPTSEKWINNLNPLLMQIAPNHAHRTEGDVDAVLVRWLLDENGEEAKPEDSGKYTDTGLDRRTEFRCLIAALYGRRWDSDPFTSHVHGAPDADDIARRCAYYGNGELDSEAINAGYEKDRDTFVFAAMTNDGLLLDRKQRKVFEESCMNGNHLTRYQRYCEQLHRRSRGFDPRPTAEWMVDESAETHESKIEQQLRGLANRMKVVEKAVAILPWLIGALTVAVLWRG